MKHILTDFSQDRWKGVDIESVEKAMIKVEGVASKSVLYGELGHPDDSSLFDISLKNVTHQILEPKLVEGKIVSDIKFLKTTYGNIAAEMIESGKFKFGIRAAGNTQEDGSITVKQIYTWDIIPV